MNEPKPTEVYFFGTCLVDVFYPEAGLAAVRLLEREGVRVLFPQGQTCCGQPPYNSGYDDEARTIARQQLALFRKPIPVVVPSGSCAGMLKLHYPALLKGDPAEAAAIELAGRVYELTEFLNRKLQVALTDYGRPTTITLHTSCSARREMQVTEDGKALLGQLKNVEIRQQDYETECCGFGGTFSVKSPDVSAAMVQDKCHHLHATGAREMICGDAGCLMNISGALEKQHIAMRPGHLAQFLWLRSQPDTDRGRP